MQWQLFFLSIPPLVAYVVLWTVDRPRWGIAAAVAVAGLEAIYNSLQLELVEPFSVASFALFLGLGGWALRTADERIFKLQPVLFEVWVAMVLVYYGVVLDTPLLAVIVEEHLGLVDALAAYQRGYARVYATTLSRSLPYLLAIHAALTAYAALKRSTWWWFNIRVFGFYAMLAILFLAERLLGVSP